MIGTIIRTIGAVTVVQRPALKLRHTASRVELNVDVVTLRNLRQQDIRTIAVPFHDDDWWWQTSPAMIDAKLDADVAAADAWLSAVTR